MIRCNSTIKFDLGVLRRLEQAQIIALEQTAEALHTEVVQAQVMPRDNGSMQNDNTFVDTSKSGSGKVSIVTNTPYARRLYFHPEYKFQKDENPSAKGEWYEDYLPGGKYGTFAQKKYKELYRRIAGV